ncbi:MAG: patatin-like phospholipase family protein [Xanthomonadaceae bacterium]|nr:patatin-like phospholipase family protein [Xanthomonadaceae bacterium]
MSIDEETLEAARSPVNNIASSKPLQGIALCLSGGGYRAMVFHLGVLWRLNELGFLARLDRISSVSGGSITAAMLGLKWHRLDFADGIAKQLIVEVIDPIRAFARKTIDIGSVAKGILLPGSVSEKVATAYRKHLFGDATLQDFPDSGPHFVINATNVQTGVLWRFSKPYMRDYLVGEVKHPTLPLATAVAASSAFPPFLSPVRLKLDPNVFTPPDDEPYHEPPYTTDVHLSDGGVYDNLGLETAWKRYGTILVSDAGGAMKPSPNPWINWVMHLKRILDIVDNQVRALRKRQLLAGFISGERQGAFWSTRSNISDYAAPDTLPCPQARTSELAAISTRLAKMPDETQERLINWGYAICDAAIRRWVAPELPAPKGFPYPRGV